MDTLMRHAGLSAPRSIANACHCIAAPFSRSGNPLPADKRRRWFDNPANASQVVLSKDYVFTFMTWQHYCNFATYKLHISSFFGLDICNVCEGQPVQVMMKDVEVSLTKPEVTDVEGRLACDYQSCGVSEGEPVQVMLKEVEVRASCGSVCQATVAASCDWVTTGCSFGSGWQAGITLVPCRQWCSGSCIPTWQTGTS
jgi:hypothetical protein